MSRKTRRFRGKKKGTKRCSKQRRTIRRHRGGENDKVITVDGFTMTPEQYNAYRNKGLVELRDY